MSAENNKATVHRIFAAMNERNLGALDALMGPTYHNHNMPTPAPGPEGIKAVLGMFFEAFPDMNIKVEQAIGEDDTVATRGHFTGTHRGNFMGVPATGKAVRVEFVDVWRFEGGKAVENWVQMDNLGLMQQLGVVPPPPGA